MTQTLRSRASVAQSSRDRRPRVARSQDAIQIEQGALDEVRYQPGIRAVVDDGGRRIRAELRGELQRLFANHEVGPIAHLQHRVRVHARPRLDGRVDVQRLLLCAEADQVETRDVDRQVQEQVAGLDVSSENAAMICGREMSVLEARAALLGKPSPLLVCRQDQEPPSPSSGM